MVASQNAVALIPIFSSNVPGHQRIFGEGRSQTVVLFCCIPIANLIYRCRCMCVLFGILLLILTKIFFAKFVQCSSQKVGLVPEIDDVTKCARVTWLLTNLNAKHQKLM